MGRNALGNRWSHGEGGGSLGCLTWPFEKANPCIHRNSHKGGANEKIHRWSLWVRSYVSGFRLGTAGSSGSEVRRNEERKADSKLRLEPTASNHTTCRKGGGCFLLPSKSCLSFSSLQFQPGTTQGWDSRKHSCSISKLVIEQFHINAAQQRGEIFVLILLAYFLHSCYILCIFVNSLRSLVQKVKEGMLWKKYGSENTEDLGTTWTIRK